MVVLAIHSLEVAVGPHYTVWKTDRVFDCMVVLARHSLGVAVGSTVPHGSRMGF